MFKTLMVIFFSFWALITKTEVLEINQILFPKYNSFINSIRWKTNNFPRYFFISPYIPQIVLGTKISNNEYLKFIQNSQNETINRIESTKMLSGLGTFFFKLFIEANVDRKWAGCLDYFF